jgi:hypothetical protein
MAPFVHSKSQAGSVGAVREGEKAQSSYVSWGEEEEKDDASKHESR